MFVCVLVLVVALGAIAIGWISYASFSTLELLHEMRAQVKLAESAPRDAAPKEERGIVLIPPLGAAKISLEFEQDGHIVLDGTGESAGKYQLKIPVPKDVMVTLDRQEYSVTFVSRHSPDTVVSLMLFPASAKNVLGKGWQIHTSLKLPGNGTSRIVKEWVDSLVPQ